MLTHISPAASYTSSTNGTPFISYFSSTTPDSESKRTRLKTVLFLQGSTLYDPLPVRARLNDHAKILKLELAILEGKVRLPVPTLFIRFGPLTIASRVQLGNHRSALSILVHDLNDSTSAEAYCTLGGEVVPAKTAQQIGERSSLQPWAALVIPLAALGKQGKGPPPMKRTKTVDEAVKKDLVMVLLEVYMSGGCVT